MEKKKNIIQYQLVKILKKTDSIITFLANENFMSFKKLIRQIDLNKITQKELSEFKWEIKINSLFNTRFILKIEDYNINNKQLNIISEYFESVNLTKFLENEQKKDRKFLKEEIIWKIFIQLSLSLYHIHNKNIIHRNITPNNILIDSKYNIKLTNFSKAFSLKNDSDLCNDYDLNLSLNNLYYTCPEILLKEKYNTKADIWSLGVVLYEMCTFNKAFNGENEEEINKKIIENIYASIGNKYSKELINLISELINKKYNERPSIKDIIHKYVFISKSKECNLYDYLDKIINPQKKRVLSSKNDKRNRPLTAVINKRIVKKSANCERNKEKNEEKKINNINVNINKEMEILTEKFIQVKKNVKNIVGEEKGEELFKELNDVNINEMINKYYLSDNNNDKENKIEKAEELKKYVEEYINIMNTVLSYKNKV